MKPLAAVGGADNFSSFIHSFIHCESCLRFVSHDDAKAINSMIEKISGVKSVFRPNNQLHIIIGTDIVNYYKALTILLPNTTNVALYKIVMLLTKQFKKRANDTNVWWFIFLKFSFL